MLGLGETTLYHACTLGRKLGLVTINPTFIPWHEDQVIRYGLQQRVIGVRAVDAKVATSSMLLQMKKHSRNSNRCGGRNATSFSMPART